MNEIPKDVKKAIVNQNIAQINQQIYDKTIACEVGKIANDDAMIKTAKEALVKLLKMEDGYKTILRGLENKNKKR